MHQVDEENNTHYVSTSWWNCMFYDTDVCRDEKAIVPDRIRRNREPVHSMSNALNYLGYTDLVSIQNSTSLVKDP